MIEPVCGFPILSRTPASATRRWRRRSIVALAPLCACALAVLLVAGCSRGTSASSAASASPITGAAPALSVDDTRILGQDSPPQIARVDYAAFPSGADPSAPGGRAYYVALSGDDSGEDSAAGSLTNPFRTIERALAMAKEGDRVFVRSGAYLSAGLDVSQSNFLLSSYQGEPVVVQAAAGGRTGLSIAHPSQHDVMVRGFSLTGFSDEGVYFGNRETMRNLVLQDLEVIGSASGMAGAYEDSVAPLVDGMLVKHVRLRDIRDIGFQFGVGPGANVRIVGLHVQMRAQVAGNSWSDGVAFEHGENVLIENSIVDGAGSDGIDLKASAVAVVNCVVRHTGRSGVKLWSDGDIINTVVYDTGADAQLVCSVGDYRILNSVFAFHNMQGERSLTATFGMEQEQALTKVLIANCVFYQLPGAVFGFSESTEPLLFNNFFCGYPDVFCYWGENEYFSPSELPATVQEDNQTVDPAFVAALQGDFHPSQGSPLLGGGTTGHGAPTFDQLLQARGGSNTVGAFQKTTSEPPSSTAGTTAATGTAPTGTAPGATELPATTFAPYANISRAQVITMVVGALRELQPQALAEPPAGYRGSLGDFDPVHGATFLAAENGDLLVGVEGFGRGWDPWAPASRGEVAQLLWNASGILTP